MIWTPDIDLFGSQVSHQLPNYVAWNPDPYIKAADALSVLWRQKEHYVFLPFCLTLYALSKILCKQVHLLILITPYWQTTLQCPKVLSVQIARTVFITNSSKTIIRSIMEIPSHSAEQHYYTSGLEGFKEEPSFRGFSEETEKRIISSRRTSTLG